MGCWYLYLYLGDQACNIRAHHIITDHLFAFWNIHITLPGHYLINSVARLVWITLDKSGDFVSPPVLQAQRNTSTWLINIIITLIRIGVNATEVVLSQMLTFLIILLIQITPLFFLITYAFDVSFWVTTLTLYNCCTELCREAFSLNNAALQACVIILYSHWPHQFYLVTPQCLLICMLFYYLLHHKL